MATATTIKMKVSEKGKECFGSEILALLLKLGTPLLQEVKFRNIPM